MIFAVTVNSNAENLASDAAFHRNKKNKNKKLILAFPLTKFGLSVETILFSFNYFIGFLF